VGDEGGGTFEGFFGKKKENAFWGQIELVNKGRKTVSAIVPQEGGQAQIKRKPRKNE